MRNSNFVLPYLQGIGFLHYKELIVKKSFLQLEPFSLLGLCRVVNKANLPCSIFYNSKKSVKNKAFCCCYRKVEIEPKIE